MDALHPRLLVGRFADAFRFYDAVLPPLTGAESVKGGPDGPYAHWDVDGQGLLSLLDRRAMAGTLGTDGEDPDGDGAHGRSGGSTVVFVCRVADVDAGYALCLRHGATPVAPPADRPDWGTGLRTAHLRDPEGTLVELQSYPDAAPGQEPPTGR